MNLGASLLLLTFFEKFSLLLKSCQFLPPAKRMLICQFFFNEKVLFFTQFDAEVDEKFLNGIYYIVIVYLIKGLLRYGLITSPNLIL